MEGELLKEEIINHLKSILVHNKQANYHPVGREEAIEYLKENKYTLSEENVLYAIKKLSSNSNISNVDMSQYMGMDIDELVNIYNENIVIPSNVIKQPIHPNLLLSSGEEVKCAFYTHNRIDHRVNENLNDEVYNAFDFGYIGRVYVTETRIIANYSPTIYPYLATISFRIKDIVSLSISGLTGDSLEIVLKSGERICLPVCEKYTSIVNLFLFIDSLR